MIKSISCVKNKHTKSLLKKEILKCLFGKGDSLNFNNEAEIYNTTTMVLKANELAPTRSIFY